MTATGRPTPSVPRSPAPADGLLLRPWHPADAAALAEAHRDDAMRRWLTDPLDDQAAAHRWIEAQEEEAARGERFSFAVVEEETGDLAGQVVLRIPRPGAQVAEVGYWTAARARGRRVAPRALEALTGWAFTAFDGLTTLELTHQESNHASCRVAQRCGYALGHVLPPWPPQYPDPGHVHVRHRDG
jgi:RimJ/RimL family protein N-acetyltransferase